MSKQSDTATVTADEIRERIGQLPRIEIAHLPTPLEEMPRLRETLGPDTPRLFVKRDDLTGLAFGGNKVRHLEFRLGDIRAKGADTMIVANVAQSNHARLHTALAARFGLTNYLLKIPSPKDDPINGNLLLDHIMGAEIVECSSAEPDVVNRELQALVERLEGEGRSVYVVPNEESAKFAGACAFMLAGLELLDQLSSQGLAPDHIFMASGTSSGGLALAGKLLGLPYRVHPMSVDRSRSEIEDYVCAAANSATDLLGFETRLLPGDVEVLDQYIGEEYGIPTDGGMEAMRLMGQLEGLILDPVYTAKAAAAMIDQIRSGAFNRDDVVVFIHTGGLPITFAYSDEIIAGLG